VPCPQQDLTHRVAAGRQVPQHRLREQAGALGFADGQGRRCAPHIEGGNGRLKSVDSALHARERRQPRGRVAQTLLSAITIMVHNIMELEQYLVASKKSPITGLDLEPSDVLPPYPTAEETATPRPQVLSRSP
jgi:hypothetical protein